MPDTAIAAGAEPGEELAVLERVVVAPCRGVFTPLDPATGDSQPVEAGDVIGLVENSGTATDVRSPFTGVIMGLLASAGERVREGEPVAWLRVTAA